MSDWRPVQRSKSLATVTWFEVSGPTPCVATFQIALREAALWLTSADLAGREEAVPPIELLIRPADFHMTDILRVVGSNPTGFNCAVKATIIVRPQQPCVIVLVVPNLTADARTLSLLVDRLTANYERMIRTSVTVLAKPVRFREPCYADFVDSPSLAERIAAVSTGLSGSCWLDHCHLKDSEECLSIEIRDQYGQLTLPLSPTELARLASARGYHRATFMMLALSAWSSVLGEVTGADLVSVLLNTTARQFDGLESLPGFFYDIGVIAMPVGVDAVSAIVAARRAVLDHHANYVPSGILCELVPAYRSIMMDPSQLLVALQAKVAVNNASIQFGRGYRTTARAQMSHGEAFSLPMDALMTLETDTAAASVVFEYRRSAIGDAAAADLAIRFRHALVSLVR